MTPDELVKATHGVENQISELNQKIIDKIVHNLLLRFEQTGKVVLSPSDEYSIKTLRRAGVAQTDILMEIQKATPGIQAEVKKAFKDAAVNVGKVKVNNYVQDKLNAPIQDGKNEVGTTFEKIIDGRINEKELSAKQKQLLEDVYSRTKNEVNKIYDGVVRTSSNAFQDACDEAARMVRAGMGPQKAVREAIKKVAQGGTYIVYPSGHKDTIEVAVLRAVRTGVNQANAKLVLDLAETTGQDLVLVSSHADARPAHQEWQGKIYSLSGKSKKYPEFREATGYGTVRGLCGANCRHTFTIYYPGVSRNPYKRNNRDGNKKKYDYAQEQRKQERDIRKQNRIIDTLENAKAETNDSDLKRELQEEIEVQREKMREKKRDYKAFCEKHNLKKQAIRTYTYKSVPGGTSTAYSNDTIKYKGVPDEWLRTKGQKISARLEVINPNGSMENCASGVVAYEMRQRGLNVIAKDKGVLSLMQEPWKAWEDVEPVADYSKNDIIELIKNETDNCRYEVAFDHKHGSHCVILEKYRDIISIVDPQLGIRYNVDEYKTEMQNILFWKISDANISKEGVKGCKILS